MHAGAARHDTVSSALGSRSVTTLAVFLPDLQYIFGFKLLDLQFTGYPSNLACFLIEKSLYWLERQVLAI